MRKLFGAVLGLALLLAAPAYAWPAHLAVSGGGGYTGPGDLGLATINSGGWWGLRAWSAAVADGTHTAIQVLKTASSETCDVFLNTSGGLGNTTACSGSSSGTPIATFCNTACTIVYFYEQTGTGWNMRQLTAANQATLTLNCIGTLPCATFGGSAYYAAFDGGGSGHNGGAQPFMMEVVGSRTANFTTTMALFSDNGNDINTQYSSTTGTVGLYGGSSTVTAAASDSAFHVLQFDLNGASSAILVDGSTTTGSPGSGQLTGQWVFGSISSGTPSFSPTGNFTEFGLWFNAFTSASLCNNAKAYWSLSITC